MTCCFCGARSVLQLRDVHGHQELACGSCAAPLHHMKPLRVDRPKTDRRPRHPYPYPARPTPKRPEKTRKRRGWFSHMVEEVWDELEDIFD